MKTEQELMQKHPGLQNLINDGKRPALIAYVAYCLGVADHCIQMAERVGIARDKLDHMAGKGTL